MDTRRIIRSDGDIHIAEATSLFSDIDAFTKGLHQIGFDVIKVREKYKFTFIRAMKSDRAVRDIELKF